VPVGAPNAPGALQLMDFVYDPKVATMITEWVIYLSPVEGVKQNIEKDAEQAVEDGYKGYANKLSETASSPYAFPDAETLSQVRFGKSITTDDEAEEWDNIFLPISQG